MTDAPGPATARAGFVLPLIAAAIGALVALPFLRNVELLGDEGHLLLAAQRMLAGEALYRDVFEILPPGAFWIVAGWMRVAGPSWAAARMLAVVVVALTACALQVILSRSSRAPRASLLLVLAWAVSTQGYWTVVNHHWLTSLLLLASLVPLVRPGALDVGPGAVAGSGVLVGCAALVTHPHAGIAALCSAGALLATRSRLRNLALFSAGIAVPVAVAVAWLWSQGTMSEAIDDVIVFSMKHYSGVQWTPYGTGVDWQTAPIVAFFPLAIVGAALAILRRRGARPDPALVAAALHAVGALVAAFPRADTAHLRFNVALALPAIALALPILLAGSVRLQAPRALAGLAAATLGAATWPYVDSAVTALRAETVRVARGDVAPGPALAPAEMRALMARIASLPRSESVAVYPFDPLVAFVDDRRHPGPIDVFIPGYTLPEQYALACRAFMASADWIAIDRTWADDELLKQLFPALRDTMPPEKTAFEAALRDAFDEVDLPGERYELRRRTVRASPSRCDRIARPDGARP